MAGDSQTLLFSLSGVFFSSGCAKAILLWLFFCFGLMHPGQAVEKFAIAKNTTLSSKTMSLQEFEQSDERVTFQVVVPLSASIKELDIQCDFGF